ncbi:MAG: hypothetical protein N2322_03715, partial [Terrimicrobiaceae bacterium]|nr:hypothetical protein [Terrimicrobiaceae bacterium]
MENSLLDLDREELAAWLASQGAPAYRAGQVLGWIYGRRVFSPAAMSDLPAGLRDLLAARFPGGLPLLLREAGSRDSTRKFLFELADGQRIETVLIPASPALYGT